MNILKKVNFELSKNSRWAYSSNIPIFLPDFIFNILIEYIPIKKSVYYILYFHESMPSLFSNQLQYSSFFYLSLNCMLDPVYVWYPLLFSNIVKLTCSEGDYNYWLGK